jgi:hypothetical protein
VGLITFAVAAARRLAHLRGRESPGAAARAQAERRREDEARSKERRRKVSGGEG